MSTTVAFGLDLRALVCRVLLGLLVVGGSVAGGTGAGAEVLRDVRFRNLDARDGLEQNTVFDIAQDPRGFVWLGTQDGLHRWDGHDFRVFEPDPTDPESLVHGSVTALEVEPRDGSLWVGTLGGLDRYDPSRGSFVHYPLTAGERAGKSRPTIHALARTGDGTLWIGTLGGGLIRLDPGSGTTEVFRHRADDPRSLAGNQVWTLAAGPEGSLWIGTGEGGLDRRRSGDGFEHLSLGRDEPLSIRSLWTDPGGTVWIGTEGDGLFRRNPDGTVRQFRSDPEDPASLAADRVWSLHRDHRGDLWVGTRGGGLHRLRGDSESFDRYLPDSEDPFSLAGDEILSIGEARHGPLLVGTGFHGLGVGNADLHFEHVRSTAEGGDLPDDVVRSLLVDSSGVTWIGTNEGLARERAGQIRAVTAPGGREILEAPVWTVEEGRDGAVWVGTDAGLAVIDPGPGISADLLRELRHRTGDPGSLGPGSVREVAFLPDGSAWIALFGGGVDLLRPDGSIRHFRSDPEDPSTLGSDLVLTLLANPDGTVWVGTAEGLDLLDPRPGTAERHRHDSSNPASLGGVQVHALYRDSRGALWIGTDWGLDRFLPGRGTFEHFTEADGLPDNTVYCILEADGNLWLSTNRGLARFDPSRGELRAFDTSDGLQALEFNGGSCAADSGGRLLFGGVNGYNVFSPSEIEVSAFQPPVVLTELRVDGESRRVPGTSGDPGEIVLEPGVRMLSLEFAALDYSEPGRNRYSYRMEGVTHGWVSLGETRELTLTNLSPGTFDVRIRGTNHDGVWSEDEARIRLRVRSPVWRSPSALIACLVLVLGAAAAGALGWRRRIRRRRWVQRTIRRNEERLQLALEGSGDGLWDWDLRTDRIVRVRMAQLLGYAPGELPPGPELWESLIHPEDRPEVLRRIDRVLHGRASSFESEYRILARDGSWRWVLDRGNIVERGPEGEPMRMAGTCTDITDRKRTETQLRLWATVFESITDGVLITGPEGTILAVNQALCRMTKRSAEELIGRDVSTLYGDSQDRAFYDHLRRILVVRKRWKGEIWQEQKDGTRFLAQVEITAGRNERDEVTHYIAVCTDITRRKRSEEKLRFLARFDPLTGLPNRTLFEDRLDHALEQARRREHRVALLFADLDQFKTVNDSLGHAAGDRLLKKVAGRVEECLRRQDTVARFGGDEFTVVLEAVEDREEIVRVAERILGALTRPFPLDGHELNVSASIGISVFPRDGEDRASLLKHADASMYRAKARGRNRYQFFAPEIGSDSVDRLTLESQLRRAVEREEFSLLYQPKIDLTSGEITGAEALVRWRHPERGLLAPSHFLGLAEETGLIVPLGEWILDKVCAQMARWESQGLATVPISVNTSTRQLAEGDYDGKVRSALERSEVPRERLTIEITETLLMESGEASVEQLRSLQTLGVGIAMDDFGTGYSSLGYLRVLPIDELKIDRSFLQGAERGDSAIIRAVVAMSDSLGLTTVGEGVETEEQLRLLRKAGCGEGQGFYFSRPVAPVKLAELLRERRFEIP